MEPLSNNPLQTPPQNIPPQTPPGEYTSEHRGHVAPIRTFSSDLATAVREKGGSVVRIAIAEEEKHRREFQEASITSKKNIFFVIVGIIVFVAAIGAIFWVYTYKKQASAPIVIPTTTLSPSIVTAEAAQTIDVSGMQLTDLLSSIKNIVSAPNVQAGTIKNILLRKGAMETDPQISASQFLTAVSPHAPADFLRSLSSDFMLGVYVYDRSSLFLMIHGTAHDFLLSGMINWEPYLFNEMAPLFNIDTSGLTKAELQNMTFHGVFVENRDARAVLDANNKPLLFYSFIDPNTILIATDSKTLAEVVRRF